MRVTAAAVTSASARSKIGPGVLAMTERAKINAEGRLGNFIEAREIFSQG